MYWATVHYSYQSVLYELGDRATARTSRNPGPDIGGQIASNRFQARVRGR